MLDFLSHPDFHPIESITEDLENLQDFFTDVVPEVNAVASTKLDLKSLCRSDHTLRVPVDTLKRYAAQLYHMADHCADTFDRIQNALYMMEENGQWSGLSLETLLATTKQNKAKFEKVIAELNKLAAFLEQFARAMEEKDNDIKREIDRIVPSSQSTNNQHTRVFNNMTYTTK